MFFTLRKTTAQLSFVQVCDGKNAVDFAVATRAGYYASTEDTKMFLISGDKHFDLIAEIIGKEPADRCSIKRADTLSIALISDAENIAAFDVVESVVWDVRMLKLVHIAETITAKLTKKYLPKRRKRCIILLKQKRICVY